MTSTSMFFPSNWIGVTTLAATAGGGYETWTCPGNSTFSTRGSYVQCCVTEALQCNINTICLNSSVLVAAQGEYTSTCSGTGHQSLCFMGWLYQNSTDPSPKTNVDCWPSWSGANWTATRTVDGVSLAFDSASSVVNASSSEAITTTSGAGPNSSTSNNRSHVSAGVIAGSVIGSVAFLAAVIGLVVFLLWRRKRRAPLEGMAVHQLPHNHDQFFREPEPADTMEGKTSRQMSSNWEGLPDPPLSPLQSEGRHSSNARNSIPSPTTYMAS